MATAAGNVGYVPGWIGFGIIDRVRAVAVHIAAFCAVSEVTAQGQCAGEVHVYATVGLVAELSAFCGIDAVTCITTVPFCYIVLSMVACWGKTA